MMREPLQGGVGSGVGIIMFSKLVNKSVSIISSSILLGNLGITPPCAWTKGAGDNAPQRAQALTGLWAQFLAGSRA